MVNFGSQDLVITRATRAAGASVALLIAASLVAPRALARPALINGALTSLRATGASAEVRSDFNGDGYSDLAIGSTGGRDRRFQDTDGEGVVHILYGSRSGLTADGDQRWTQESAGIADTKFGPFSEDETGDDFGSELATGDFDGDGFADLAIGSPGEHPLQDPRPHSLGAVHILYGSANGLKGSNTIRWPAKIGIEDNAIQFGSALTGGDFDGDGVDDLAIVTGWSGDFNNAPEDKVAVAILPGTVDGLKKVASTIWYEPANAPWGNELASGDIDGDGLDDIALGIPYAEVDALWGAGLVRVLFGDAVEVGTRSVLLTQETDGLAQLPGETDGAAADEYFGTGLSIGDFDLDGHADLAMGTPNESVPGVSCLNDSGLLPRCHGVVTVVPGGEDGLDLESSFVLAQGIDGLAGSSERGDAFGGALASGDLNRDGWIDLAIGAPGETIDTLCPEESDDYPTDGICGHGAVTVVSGSADGLVPSSSSRWTLVTPGVPGKLNRFGYDSFAATLAIGSYGKGRAADLAIGVPSGGNSYYGFVDVLYGSTAGLSADGAQLWSPNSTGIKGTSVALNFFGLALGQ